MQLVRYKKIFSLMYCACSNYISIFADTIYGGDSAELMGAAPIMRLPQAWGCGVGLQHGTVCLPLCRVLQAKLQEWRKGKYHQPGWVKDGKCLYSKSQLCGRKD